MSPRRVDLGVDWFLPGARRRFTTTTQATSDLIRALAVDQPAHTWSTLRAAINYDGEARTVCDGFIEAGHGATRVAPMVGAP